MDSSTYLPTERNRDIQNAFHLGRERKQVSNNRSTWV